MPGRDGTGPDGYGAMTGRGLGACGSGIDRSAGMSFGRGCRCACGRGTGGYMAEAAPKETLQVQKEMLERRLKLVNRQLETHS